MASVFRSLTIPNYTGYGAPVRPALPAGFPSTSTGGAYPPNPQIPEALGTVQDINRFNLNYLGEGIPGYADLTGKVSGVVSHLLDPNDPVAMRDVAQRGAENAVAGGYSGAPIQNFSNYNLREADIERRAGLANTLLSGAVGRLPNPADPSRQLITPLQQRQLELEQQRINQGGLPRGGGAPSGGGGGAPWGGAPRPPSYGTTPDTEADIDRIIAEYFGQPEGYGYASSQPANDQGVGATYDANLETWFPQDYSPFGTAPEVNQDTMFGGGDYGYDYYE